MRWEELRLKTGPGQWSIFNNHTEELRLEFDHSFEQLPLLVSISDQGAVNMSALSYLMFSNEAILLHAAWDPYHRCWNDVKNACRRSSAGAWRAILELTVVFNINYGPFGQGSWFFKKQALLENILANAPDHQQQLQEFEALICQERRCAPPRDATERNRLLQSLSQMENFRIKGPLVKLMRWFSWFEACLFMEGDFFATKCVMLDPSAQAITTVSDGENNQLEQPHKGEGAKDHKAELAKLKKRIGTFRLAPQLITPKNVTVKDCLLSVMRATWQRHAAQAREVKTPFNTEAMHIRNAHLDGWMNELVEMVWNSCWREETIRHLSPHLAFHPNAVEWQADLLTQLLQTRAMSLASTYCIPPLRYAHALSEEEEIAAEAKDTACRDWESLLNVELVATTMKVKCLDAVAWRQSPFCRALLMAFEKDMEVGSREALALLKPCVRNLGDSRVIENVHQHGRDLQRSAKHNRFGDVQIMANVLKSNVLEERQTPIIRAHNAQKVLHHGSSFCAEPIARKLSSKGHKLPLSIQKMMLPKSKEHSWISPNPASLFQSACATQWFVRFSSSNLTVGIEAASLSILARPGWTLAQRSSGTVFRVIASGDFAFLGWALERRETLEGQTAWVLPPNLSCIHWLNILDLDDWLFAPVSPCLLTPVSGPLGWLQTAEAGPVHVQWCLEGCQGLTVDQMHYLATCLGPELPCKKTRMAYQQHIIERTLGPGQHAAALELVETLEAGGRADDDIDSEFSEVLSDLGKEDGNTQDLQEFREKKQRLKAKRKLAEKTAASEPRVARGKAKAKPKGKPSRKPTSFLEGVLRRQRKQAEELKKATDLAASVGEQEKLEERAADSDMMSAGLVEQADGPASSGAGEAGGRVGMKKMYKSPEEILGQLAPPSCFMGLSFTDHRFNSTWRFDTPELQHPYDRRNKSANFGKSRTWQDALSQVHEHCWRKWAMLKKKLPLPPAEQQTPGVIAQAVLDSLEPIIEGMPPRRR